MNKLPIIYSFDNFRFDPERLALYYKDELISDGDKKTMQVLAVLLSNPNKLTSHEEIIEEVWRDNPHGATAARIGQYIKRLRKIFTELEPEKEYITNIKGRGYKFAGNIVFDDRQEATITPEPPVNGTFSPDEVTEEPPNEKLSVHRPISRFAFVLLITVLTALTIFAVWMLSPGEKDEEQIRRTIKESQLYESLVLYKNPKAFEENLLDKYWLDEPDISLNADRNRIRESIIKLKNDGRHYGEETKCEQFEFQSVEVNKDGNFAVVKTLEKWFISVYFDDGTLQRNRTVGPYFVSYILRKKDDKWLIEKSTTARVQRPVPHISNIEIISEPRSKEQFFVKITGQDFEPETVLLEVIGEGCPESKPCKVPNSALREKSQLSDTILNNVPLTLATGNFKIVTRNGDSQPSNPFQITIP